MMRSKYLGQDGEPDLDSTYTGEFKDGLYHGKGTLVVKDGFTYTGDWVHGAREGTGVLRVPVNDTKNEYFKEVGFEVYEGQFLNDLLHGQAKATYADGTTYEG